MASLTIDLIIDQSEERSAVPAVAAALVQQVYTGPVWPVCAGKASSPDALQGRMALFTIDERKLQKTSSLVPPQPLPVVS